MSFSQFLTQSRQRVDRALHRQLDSYHTHPDLQKAMRYSLFNGGKRIRPILVYASSLAVTELSGCSDQAAVAVESLHTYSLIHDDLPAMDDDDLRRGKPACHIAFDEGIAILAGDAMQTMAFEALSYQGEKTVSADIQLAMINTLAVASGAQGMVAGQSMDLAAVHTVLSLPQLENIHALKTGALINACVRLGALSTGLASPRQLDALASYATCLGLAFQIQDDILDVTTDTATLGKPQGTDAQSGKPTYVSLLGMDGAVLKIRELHTQALDALGLFDDRACYLRDLSAYLVHRSY